MELTERKKKILRAVVESYIRTAEPVGSKAILDLTELKVSSATIRNELSDLTEMGYLEQPHTSAGRVPSPKGYRLYVNELMDQAIREFRYKDALVIDDAFHAEIVRLAGNSNLEFFTEKVRMLISRIRWLSLLTSNLSVTAGEHNHIIDCLVNKDKDAAMEAMREHIYLAEESFSRIYENNSDYEKSYQVLKTLTNKK